MEYDLVISLGPACETAYQLKRTGLRHASMPFDWTILEFRPMFRCFDRDFEGFLTIKDDLVVRDDNIFNQYGVQFLHELQEEGYPDFEDAKAKYERRIKRLLNIMNSAQRVLFIRRGGMAKDQAQELNKLWQSKYTVDYHVAVIDKRPIDWKLHRFTTLYLPPTDNWQGNDEAWDEIFEKIT
jgi:hypothetical protein